MIDIERIKNAMNGKKLVINHCTFCNYSCGYFYRGKKLFYDNGCYCVPHGNITIREQSDLIDFFEKNNLDIDWVQKHLEAV